eukprot:PhM_4_TR16746/c0_g1_i1/m.56067
MNETDAVEMGPRASPLDVRTRMCRLEPNDAYPVQRSSSGLMTSVTRHGTARLIAEVGTDASCTSSATRLRLPLALWKPRPLRYSGRRPSMGHADVEMPRSAHPDTRSTNAGGRYDTLGVMAATEAVPGTALIVLSEVRVTYTGSGAPSYEELAPPQPDTISMLSSRPPTWRTYRHDDTPRPPIATVALDIPNRAPVMVSTAEPSWGQSHVDMPPPHERAHPCTPSTRGGAAHVPSTKMSMCCVERSGTNVGDVSAATMETATRMLRPPAGRAKVKLSSSGSEPSVMRYCVLSTATGCIPRSPPTNEKRTVTCDRFVAGASVPTEEDGELGDAVGTRRESAGMYSDAPRSSTRYARSVETTSTVRLPPPLEGTVCAKRVCTSRTTRRFAGPRPTSVPTGSPRDTVPDTGYTYNGASTAALRDLTNSHSTTHGFTTYHVVTWPFHSHLYEDAGKLPWTYTRT